MAEQPKFLRVFRKSEEKEILINLSSIWKIEASYAEVSGRQGFATTLQHGMENPDCIRVYEVFFGSDKVLLSREPDSPVFRLIEQLYKDAIKGSDKPPKA